MAASLCAATFGVSLVPLGDPAASAPLVRDLGGPLRGDPDELDDGFNHILVAYRDGQASTAPRGAVPRTLAAPSSSSLVEPDSAVVAAVPPHGAPQPGTVWRTVPVSAAGGELDAAALARWSALGRVVGLYRSSATAEVQAVVEVAGAAEEGAAARSAAAGSERTGPPVEGVDRVELVGVAADDPHVVELAAVPGTRRIEGVGGPWYAVTTDSDVAAYAALPGVAAAGPDVVLGVFDDPLAGEQWHLANAGSSVAGITGVVGADIGAPEAWAVADGAGVVVAVVDTGMEISHPDLLGRIWTNDDDCGDGIDDDANGYVDDCHGWDFLEGDGRVDDTGRNAWGRLIDNTHATHLAGIVAASRDNGIGVAGVAPGATVMPLKISDASSMSMATAATAIRYAVDNGADIVNCSFGTSAGTPLSAVQPLQDAVRYAEAHGVLVVAAAGNDARDIDAVPTYPAAFPEANVISVGASTNADTRASFSNWGATSVDLFAPGWSIVSTLPGGTYGSLHGTSMASPVVAGAASALLQAQPALDAAGVKAALLTGSTVVPELGGISVSGQRLDLGRIVNPSGAQGGEPVSFTFEGFDGAQADVPSPASVVASLHQDAAAAGTAVSFRATLLTDVNGTAYGVSGAELVTDDGAAVTDDAASVALSPPAGLPLEMASGPLAAGFALPAGSYALVTEARAVPSGERLGRPWAVFFTVAKPGEAPPPPSVGPLPTTPSPVGGGSPPGASTPTTQWSWGGTTPTTQWSWGGTTPTTQWSWSGPPTTWTWGGTTPTTQWSWTGPPTTWTWSAPTTPQRSWSAPPTTQWSWGTSPTTQRTSGTVAPTTTRPTEPAPTTTRPMSLPAPPAAPAPTPVRSGALMASSVSPRRGTTTGGTRVRIDGEGFTSRMYVRFGDSPGTDVLVISPTALLVTSPAHAVSGAVDVRVATARDAVVLPGAYTYALPGSTIGTPAPSDPTSSPGGAPVPAPPPPLVPATTTTTTPPSASPPSNGTTDPGAPSPGPSDAFTFGPVTQTRGSLLLRPLLGSSPLDAYPPSTWPLRRCSTPTCAGAKL